MNIFALSPGPLEGVKGVDLLIVVFIALGLANLGGMVLFLLLSILI